MSDQATSDFIHVEKIQPAYTQVAVQLRALILGGQLAAGARLPNETELCSMFSVSRSTVREALRVLSSQNLIVTRRGVSGGTFVAHPQPGQVSDYLETSFSLMSASEQVTVAELLELRSMLEVPAAGLAAARRTDADLVALKQVLDQERQRSDDEERSANGQGYEGHRLFHQTIIKTTGNTLLDIVTQPLFNTLRHRFLRDNAPPSFWQRTHEDHERIYEQIANGNEGAARAEMDAHIGSLAEFYDSIDRQRNA